MTTEAQKRANAKYKARVRIQKPVDFNRDNNREIALLEWADKQGPWQTYVKRLIEEDFRRNSNAGSVQPEK